MDVCEATAEVETTSGAIVHVFTSGTTVQLFLLSGTVPSGIFNTAGNRWNGVIDQPDPSEVL
jgi:hypothetical protein